MSKHGYRHVRKVNDGRPKPYFGRVWIDGAPRQVGGFKTAVEAHQAAAALRQSGSASQPRRKGIQ